MTVKEIKEKFKVKYGSTVTTLGDNGGVKQLYLEPYDFVYDFLRQEYGGKTYKIVKNTTDLTEDEIADIVSDGFNFGYRINRDEITIYTD